MNAQIKTSKRVMALDVLRGITIAGMILVNNPGSWSHIYAPLEHAEWNGLTPTDLVFPFFMFIMGISTYISLSKFNFKVSREAIIKIIRRSIVIFMIGIGIAWFSKFCHYWLDPTPGMNFAEHLFEASWTFDSLRILGVMQRLGISYCAAAIIALTIKHKRIPWIILTLLIGYFIVLVTGNGFEYNETNILSLADRTVLTISHMYKDNGIDPEGLLSSIPSIAHVLLGFCIGEMILGEKNSNKSREEMLDSHITRLFIAGAILTFSGFLLSYGCPINKKIWSPTFVLTTCGLASTLLALLIWIIDIKGYKKWSRFFESFGVNPLFMYVMGGVIGIIIGSIPVFYNDNATTLHGFIYNELLVPPFGDTLGSLLYALLYVGFIWCIGYQLYKRRIYIKI